MKRFNALIKWIADRFLMDFDENQCDSFKAKSGYFSFLLMALVNLIDYGKYPYLRLVGIAIVFALQWFLNCLYDHRMKQLRTEKEKEFVAQQRQLSLFAETEKKYKYHQCLARERAVLLNAINAAFVEKNLAEFYTRFLDSVKELLLVNCGLIWENISLHLYVYDPSIRKISRVAISNSVPNMKTPQKKERTIPKKKKKFYEKCITNKSKHQFFLKDTKQIKNKLVGIDEDDISQYSQYFCVLHEGKKFNFLIEILSFNGVTLDSDDGNSLAKNVTAPLLDFFDLLENEAVMATMLGGKTDDHAIERSYEQVSGTQSA